MIGVEDLVVVAGDLAVGLATIDLVPATGAQLIQVPGKGNGVCQM